MDNGFKNAVVDALVEARPIGNTGNRWEPSVSTSTIMYTGIPEYSPARRLVANMWWKHENKSWVTVLSHMLFTFGNNLVEAFIDNKYSSDMRSVRLGSKLYHQALKLKISCATSWKLFAKDSLTTRYAWWVCNHWALCMVGASIQESFRRWSKQSI